QRTENPRVGGSIPPLATNRNIIAPQSAAGGGMDCPRCQAANEAGARFCEECGAGLEIACSKCGSRIPAGKNFCRSCGAAAAGPLGALEKTLTSQAALEGERKQVTVLFADLKGS